MDTLNPNNPYVGPRSIRAGEAFFGRDREIRSLSALLIAERIVLLHSPSGAGKTSLIQAGLVPRLAERFTVLPLIRANLEPPEVARGVAGLNRYTLSTLISLEEVLPSKERVPMVELATFSLDAYLEKRILPDTSTENCLLIFDQFEEVLTVSPTDAPAKLAFFEQVGEAFQNRHRWALFAIREDYMGGLAPFVRAIPNRLNVTFRLGLLGSEAAKLAIQQPAKNKGVDFTDEAAQKLVDDLRRIQVQQPDGTFVTEAGPSVEPVQLQVVCFNLWQSHAADDKLIDEGDLQRVGSVDQALASYYAKAVKSVSESTNLDERILRRWFDEHLITQEGIRSQVLKGADSTEGLPNIILRLLENTHLVRGETRAGKTWYELAHDRLVSPVRKDNVAWFEKNLSLLQRQSVLWNEQGRSEGLLLRGKVLEDEEEKAQSLRLTSDEGSFFEACRRLRDREQRDRNRNRLLMFLAIGATVAMLVAAIFWGQAKSAQASAEQLATMARTRELASLSIANLDSDPEFSLHLAIQSLNIAYTLQGEDALRRALIPLPVKYTLKGHTDEIYSVAYDPTGQRLITASADGTARIWDAATGQELMILSGHTGPVYKAAFSPDGRLAATAGEDHTVRIWDAVTGQLVKNLDQHTGAVNGLSFSPDGGRLVTASADKSAIVWDIESGEVVFNFPHEAEVRAAVFSPGGSYIATGGLDQSIDIWNASSGQLVTSLWNSYGINSLAFSPDEQYILSDQGYNAGRWDFQNAYVYPQYSGQHTWYVTGVVFSPDGEQVVTTSRDHSVVIWDSESGLAIETLRGHSGIVYTAAFDPQGEHLATAGEDQTVRIWNIAAWRKWVLFDQASYPFRAVYSPDGGRIAATASDGMVRIWEVESGRELYKWRYPDYLANRIHFSPDGQKLITASDDGTWRIFDVETGNQLYISQANHFIVSDARFSNDGTRIITTRRDGLGEIWDATTMTQHVTQLVTLDGHLGGIWSGTFSPDGKLAVTCGADSTAKIWDVRTGELLHTLSDHSDLVVSVEFDSEGKRVVTASVDGTARIWEVETGKMLLTLRGHASEVTDALFSPDGKLVATASRDDTLILWDADTGEEIIQLLGHHSDVLSVAFSPDGRYLVSTSLDGTARVYPVYFEDVLALAQSVLSPREMTCEERLKYLHEEIVCPTPTPELSYSGYHITR